MARRNGEGVLSQINQTKPSKEALEIQSAHDMYRNALGTQNESSALAYLEAVVRRVQRRSRA